MFDNSQCSCGVLGTSPRCLGQLLKQVLARRGEYVDNSALFMRDRG